MSALSAPPGSWPTVPACYGWLSLDRRGRWRLREEVVEHLGLLAYLGTNYGADEVGHWLVRNGPQRVYVELEYTPWVWRLGAEGSLTAHTGADGGYPIAAFVDEDGVVLLQSVLGVGVLDDRDLAAFLGTCRGCSGKPATEAELLGALEAAVADAVGVFWNTLPLQPVRREGVAARFGFVPQPVAL